MADSPTYRAIYLGADMWAVRRFSVDGCQETRFMLHVDDPQLRASDNKAIETAKTRTDWRKV